MLHGRQWLGGDIMVAWRAWVIWSRSKAVMTVLMFPLLLTTGKKLVLISAFYILIAWTRPVAAAVIVASTTKAQLRYVSEDRLTPAWAIRDIRIAHYGSIAVWTCSLLTNVVSTGLIGIKMWYVYCLVNCCYNLIDTTLRSTHDSLFLQVSSFVVSQLPPGQARSHPVTRSSVSVPRVGNLILYSLGKSDSRLKLSV